SSSSMRFAIEEVISGFDAASGFGKDRYATALRLRILERVAQMTENGDKDAKKALKMDGLFSKFKRASTFEKSNTSSSRYRSMRYFRAKCCTFKDHYCKTKAHSRSCSWVER